MRRLLLCLPLCLSLAPGYPGITGAPQVPLPPGRAFTDDGATLPDDAGMRRLAREQPLAFLEHCMRRCLRTVRGCSLTFEKQERIDGELKDREVIAVHYRHEPHSVFFQWVEGARLVQRALYVEGENGGQSLVRPAKLGKRFVWARDVDGPEARQSGRYTLREFGLFQATERTWHTWRAAADRGALHVEYLGERVLPQAGNRRCHVLQRSRYARPEADGITQATIYIDTETWLQVGTELHGEGGRLIGAYYFRDIRLNPTFEPNPFRREAL